MKTILLKTKAQTYINTDCRYEKKSNYSNFFPMINTHYKTIFDFLGQESF